MAVLVYNSVVAKILQPEGILDQGYFRGLETGLEDPIKANSYLFLAQDTTYLLTLQEGSSI